MKTQKPRLSRERFSGQKRLLVIDHDEHVVKQSYAYVTAWISFSLGGNPPSGLDVDSIRELHDELDHATFIFARLIDRLNYSPKGATFDLQQFIKDYASSSPTGKFRFHFDRFLGPVLQVSLRSPAFSLTEYRVNFVIQIDYSKTLKKQ